MKTSKRILTLSFGLLLLLISEQSFGALFQVLHTNDIHGHMDHTTQKVDVGGYGRLKVVMDDYKQWGLSQGIPSIAMDAGDYMEGNLYYLADRGKSLYQIHGSVGFDVAVIGNHDYLMGARDLNEILKDTNTDFQLLGANLHIDKKYKETQEKMKPYWETVVNGVKVGVIGITLDDLLYEWSIGEGHISDEVDAAKKYAKELRARGNDVVIALTHVGFSKDKKIARKVPEIDLIVGGHSHSNMFKVHYEKSKGGKQIPIVQAGKHLEYMGQLLLDFDFSKKKLNVVSYDLIPIKSHNKDQLIESYIDIANDQLEQQFGPGWLGEIVGYSNLAPRHLGGNKNVWQYVIADSIREAIQADFSVNQEALSGTNYPTHGPITRRDIYNSNPRHFEFDKKFGYDIYSTRIRGVWISLVIRAVLRLGIPLYVTGMTFDYKELGPGRWDERYKVKNIRIHGKRINPFKYYKVALPEAIVRGGFAITPWVGLLLKFPDNYMVPMWRAIEEKVRRLGVVGDDYLQKYFGKPTAGRAPAVNAPFFLP